MSDKPTSAQPIVIDGFTFRCYRCGVLQHQWRSDDGRLKATRISGKETYCAAVDGKYLRSNNKRLGSRARRFMTLQNAMRAAVAAAQS